MKKRSLLIGVFAVSMALTLNAEARVSDDLAHGKTPTQAASSAYARGDNPGQISRALRDSGVSVVVAANVVATAPRQSRGYGDSGAHDRGEGFGLAHGRGRGFDLSEAIDRFKELHDHRHGVLAKWIAYFKQLHGWHHHHPGGPSPC